MRLSILITLLLLLTPITHARLYTNIKDCITGPNKLLPGEEYNECFFFWDYDLDLDVDLQDYASYQSLSPTRTADQPDSWLVLYNINNPDSIAWKDWYITQWNIPTENTLGLNTSNSEKIHTSEFESTIYYPIQQFLFTSEIRKNIMGILVGYRVPGNFYENTTLPELQGGGGWSVSNRLQDMASLVSVPYYNPHFRPVYSLIPQNPRLTKQSLGAHVYLTARIDAPTLQDAKNLTIRAKNIMLNGTANDFLYYDYYDPGAVAGDIWDALELTVLPATQGGYGSLPNPPYPWIEWESETDPTPNCMMQFSYYRITGWQNMDWSGSGSRVIGYALNSWGATTLRSTTDHGGRYAPNLLFNGGFAAAIAATAEPYLSTAPVPSSIVYFLCQGYTTAEATLHSQVRKKWMWELIGDPLLKLPTP